MFLEYQSNFYFLCLEQLSCKILARVLYAALKKMECIQFNTIQVDNYRDELCTKAKAILTEEIPSQLAQLETILDGDKIRSRLVRSFFVFLTRV